MRQGYRPGSQQGLTQRAPVPKRTPIEFEGQRPSFQKQQDACGVTKPEPFGRQGMAYLVMCLTPLFFSSNLIFGRHISTDVAPFTLAFIRWTSVALILAPFILRERAQIQRLLRQAPLLLLVLGFLGMWICGAIVYLGLQYTTATNATLIYTASPVMIVALEAIFGGRRIGRREAVGITIAIAGVGVIILKGSLTVLLTLSFNVGDLLLAAAAISWSVYSVLYRNRKLSDVSSPALFGVIAAAGAITLFPFVLFEIAAGAEIPLTAEAWLNIAGIILCASLLAFSGYQFGLRVLGPSVTGVFMYLLPPYGVFLAVVFLGEAFLPYHQVGIALVMAGVILATLPVSAFARKPAE